MIGVGDGRWKARCPVPDHQDRNTSLSVRLGEKAVLLHCFAGCNHGEIMFHLGLRWADLFGRPGSVKPREAPVRPNSQKLEEAMGRFFPLAGPIIKPLHDRGMGDDLICLLTGLERMRWSPLNPLLPSHPEGIALLAVDEDALGRGIQVRTGKPGRKYQWLVGGEYGEPGSPYHVALMGKDRLGQGFRVTEGIIKAEVSAYRTGVPTVGITGVNSWKELLPMIEKVRPPWVALAFDMDWRENAAVRRCRRELAQSIVARRVDVYCESWSADHNGIDDFLAAGIGQVDRQTWTEGS